MNRKERRAAAHKQRKLDRKAADHALKWAEHHAGKRAAVSAS